MKATAFLEKQHREIETLFREVAGAPFTEQPALFQRLASRLAALDEVERRTFYPAFELATGMSDALGNAYAAHGLIEFCLFQADRASEGDDFRFRLATLRDVVEHHLEEEEYRLLPEVAAALGAGKDEQLGTLMEREFDIALARDFRPLLEINLRQVLSGALRTRPDDEDPRKRPTAKKTKSKGRTHRHAQ